MSEAEATEREYVVACDGVSIPMCDMRTPGFLAKFFSKNPAPKFAAESRRIIRVESEQVPRRILKHFKELQGKVAPLSYKHNFHATIPVVGPLAISMMSMVTASGQNSFFAVRSVIRSEGKLIDKGFHGFCSFLEDEDLLITMSNAQLPRAREGVDRLIISNDNPEAIVREHRIRMREYKIVPTEPADVVERIRLQNSLDLDDYLERGLLRYASVGELARIRQKSKDR